MKFRRASSIFTDADSLRYEKDAHALSFINPISGGVVGVVRAVAHFHLFFSTYRAQSNTIGCMHNFRGLRMEF
jgi:hypothetical protein